MSYGATCSGLARGVPRYPVQWVFLSRFPEWRDRMIGLPTLLLLGLVLPQASPDTLRLADALAEAGRGNPMLQAARLRAAVAVERVGPAGVLPDPGLQLGLMNRPVSGFGTSEPMTMNTVAVSQMLPWPGKLHYGREQAQRIAAAESLDAEELAARLGASVTRGYVRIAFIDRALTVMSRTRELLRDLLGVSTQMYSVGSSLQQDVFQAQVAVARMGEDITVMEQERIAMAARFNALLGRTATAPVPALQFREGLDALPTVDSLLAAAAQRRPALQAARERVAAAEAGYRGARRELYPDLMLSLQYGQRPQFGDMATLMVGVSLPIWAGQRQLAMRREMAAMRAMREAEATDLYNETYAQITELRAAVERTRALARLYDTGIIPQARASVEAALSAYRVGRVDFMSLVENQMTVNRYEVERLRLTAEYHQLAGDLAALLGPEDLR